MPYLITVKRRDDDSRECGGCGERYDDGTACEDGAYVSRRAVATREDAETMLAEAVHSSGVTDDALAWAELIVRCGGTTAPELGPLPDGTVIEVERVEWIDLARTVGISGQRKLVAKPILDAYNARQVIA